MADEPTMTPPETSPLTASPEPRVEASPVRNETPTPREASPLRDNPFEAAAERAQSTAKAPAPVVRRGGVGLFTTLFFSVLAVGGGAYLALFAQSRPDLMQSVGLAGLLPQAAIPSEAASRLSALETKLADLEREISRIGQASAAQAPAVASPPAVVAGQSPSTPPENAQSQTTTPASPATLPSTATGQVQAAVLDVGGLRAQLEGVSGRVTAIETRLAALDPTGAGGAIIAGLQAEIANLKAVVQGLQQQAASTPSPGVTFAVVSLAEAANRPGPFLPEFEAVRAAMPGVPEVALLEPLARSGAPSRALLLERFADLAPAVEKMSAPNNGQGGFWAWFRSLFSDMVKIQPSASSTDSGPTAILMRAKTKLDQGDLAGAVVDVRGVAPAPDEVRGWIASAEKRLEIEARIAALRGAVERGRAAPAPAALPQPVGIPATTGTGSLPVQGNATGPGLGAPPVSNAPTESQP